ncbi:hypothetical protein [Rhodococcus qingshengii]|uniref:hypothetical protein n=1 Tax=Rhodococcus qingshengii TaxID=334542 RepID=UPI0022B2CD54|nr:hypothetical protein [Rhodococcus qingshengii]MCZ4618450.1 hypothetical protein [Rhodococcus qingshengii]
MRVDGVDDHLIEDAGELLLDSLDVLLERVASRGEFAPKAGSPQWLSEWNDRDSDAGRVRARQHVLVRIALAAAAHITVRTDIELARQMGIPEDVIERAQGVRPRSRKRKGRNISDECTAQPALW